MAETDAFCWVNGVGMPHEWRFSLAGARCKRCGAWRHKIGTPINELFGLPHEPPKNAQEGQDAPKTVSTPENEGQNA